MKNEFVPYNLALKLRELNFDEECLAWYDWVGKELYLYSELPSYLDINPTKASLWQQAFDWFREKHNLPSWIYESTGEYYFKIVQGYLWVQHQGVIFKSYEEARKACLEKLIKLII